MGCGEAPRRSRRDAHCVGADAVLAGAAGHVRIAAEPALAGFVGADVRVMERRDAKGEEEPDRRTTDAAASVATAATVAARTTRASILREPDADPTKAANSAEPPALPEPPVAAIAAATCPDRGTEDSDLAAQAENADAGAACTATLPTGAAASTGTAAPAARATHRGAAHRGASTGTATSTAALPGPAVRAVLSWIRGETQLGDPPALASAKAIRARRAALAGRPHVAQACACLSGAAEPIAVQVR